MGTSPGALSYISQGVQSFLCPDEVVFAGILTFLPTRVGGSSCALQPASGPASIPPEG